MFLSYIYEISKRLVSYIYEISIRYCFLIPSYLKIVIKFTEAIKWSVYELHSIFDFLSFIIVKFLI